MNDLNLQRLAASKSQTHPRVLVLAAPPGYGKRSFLRVYAPYAGPLNYCDLGGAQDADPTRPILDALVGSYPSRAARSAADRLVQRRPAMTLREVLRREWAVSEVHELFALHDPGMVLGTPGGLDLLSELIRTLPLHRTLAISTGPVLAPALQELVAQERAAVVDARELGLTADEVQALVREAGYSARISQTLYRCTQGWPLVSRLLADLLRRQGASAILEAAAALPRESLLSFGLHRSIAGLPAVVREVVALVTAMGNTTYTRIVRVLGDACDDAVFAQAVKLPFVELEQAALRLHPEASRVLRERFAPLVGEITERALNVLMGDGAYAEAARIALESGDAVRAAAIIDVAPPYTTAQVSLADYERVIGRIDRTLITRFPNLWIATIPYRSLSIEPATYVREAEAIYFCLSPVAAPEQRAAALMLLGSAYINVGRWHDSDQLIDEALQGFASEDSRARASILNFAASLRGIEGRFTLARALARQASIVSRDAFGENQTLHYIEAHEAAYRGKQQRVIVIIDELMLRRAREGLPLYLAYAATNGMIISWVNGDDASFARYLSALEDAVTPGLELGFAPLIEAAHEWPVEFPSEQPWPVVSAMVQLYRMGSAKSTQAALEAARAAAAAADQRRDPYMRALAHAALYVLDEPNRESRGALLQSIVAPVESPELHAAVEGLLGGGSAGMLDPFIQGRVLRRRERPKLPTRVELIAGRVTRGGEPVPLYKKEFELLALLASTRGSLPRDSIGESIWDHLDPEKWGNNVKVTVNRIRKKLGHEAIVSDEVTKQYRLGPTVEVDLRRLEGYIRQRSLPADSLAFFEDLQCDTTVYQQSAWGQGLAARINDAFCSVGVMLAETALASGAHDSAHEHAARVLRTDPYNERACELLVRIRLERGDTDGARREFQRYASELKHQFGVEPARQFAELVTSQRTAGAALSPPGPIKDRSPRPSAR